MNPTSGSVESSVIDGIGIVTINRPQRMNALSGDDSRSMDAIFGALDDDAGVRAVIVTGAGGRAFCAGADLKAGDDNGPRVSFGAITGVAGPMRSMKTPLIAAVCGYAIGGGFELAAACDIIIAGLGATFSIPEGTIGNLAESPVGQRAMRHLPYHVAMDMALTGRRITAEEAARWGFVNYLVDDSAVLDTALDVGRKIAASSPVAIQAFKFALTTGAEWPLENALTRRFEPIEAYQTSTDHAEMVAAAREGRPPQWHGR